MAISGVDEEKGMDLLSIRASRPVHFEAALNNAEHLGAQTNIISTLCTKTEIIPTPELMTDLFFGSFNQKFWTHVFPDNSLNRSFILAMWTKGMYASTDRTFVAVDTADSHMIIGVSRWQAPLHDQSTSHDSWPDPSVLDQDIAILLFQAEDLSRRTIMGDRPHWYLDIIGVDQKYRGQGIGKRLMAWGVRNADKERVDIFLNGTEVARDFYQQQYGFKMVGEVLVPDDPAYGTYQHVSMIRTSSSDKAIHPGKL